MAPLFKSSSFRSPKTPKSIISIKVGLAKLRGWSRKRQDSVCSTGSTSSIGYSTYPLWGAGITSESSCGSSGDVSPPHSGASNFSTPTVTSQFSGDEEETPRAGRFFVGDEKEETEDGVFTSEGKEGIPFPCCMHAKICRGSAPPAGRLPRPPESMISPIPDRLRSAISSRRRGSAPEPKIPRHIQEGQSTQGEKRRKSAPTVISPGLKSPFKSPKSIKTIRVGLAKLKGWSRKRQASPCSCPDNYCTHPLWGPGGVSSPSSSSEGSPTHVGVSNLYTPTGTRLFSGDNKASKQNVYVSDNHSIPIPCGRRTMLHRGSAPTKVRLPRPPEGLISPIPDHMKNALSCQRRGSAPEPNKSHCHIREQYCEHRRGSAPAVVEFPKPKDEVFAHIPPRLDDPKIKYRRGSAPAVYRCPQRNVKQVTSIPSHLKSSCRAHRRDSSPSIGYIPRPRRRKLGGSFSTPTIDHVTSVANLNGSLNIGSPNIFTYDSLVMPGVAETVLNEAVSSLRLQKESGDISSSSWCFHSPDAKDSHSLSKITCYCSHLENKEKIDLSPSLSGPVDVTITLPRTPHKSPVAKDTFKISSTVICEDGSTRCGSTDHRRSSPNFGYVSHPTGKQLRESVSKIDHAPSIPDINRQSNIGSPIVSYYELMMPCETKSIVNEAVSSLSLPKEFVDIRSNSRSSHLPDVKEFCSPSKQKCQCSHVENKEKNNLSPGLSGPLLNVHITLPRAPHKSPVAEDNFKISSTVSENGSTRCGPAVRSKHHKTQSADGLLSLSDLDSTSILPITVPQQKSDAERISKDMKSMGIKDEFHQKAILVCIDQLQNGGHDGDLSGPGVGDCSTPASHHTLRNHSFHDLRRCDKCGLYLRGFIHQGQFCQDCGLIAHRTCAATGLPPCVQHSSSYFSRILLSSVFGLSLCTQFNPGESIAPLLLVRCCEELLYQAKSDSSLDLYRLYRTPPQQDSLAKLREACDDDINAADLGLHEPHVIAYLIKRYLRELPEPVIPENCYDRFIGAAQIDNDEQCARSITQLVKELNPHHYYTLKFLMTHFLQLCQLQVSRGNKDPPTLLIQSLCHVFLRPPWDKIVELARNTDYHMRIVEMLLLKVDWGEKVPSFPSAPALPPRIRPRQSVQSYSSSGYDPVDPIMSPSSPPMGMGPIMPIAGPLPVTNIPSDAPKALQESEWYWGNITRDDVNVLMRDAKDGTFLVRDASTGNNEYTLTVRKGGSNKLIKICHRNGMYGFIEPLNFNSVVDLINYCQQQNLSQFNKALDIKLLYPVSRNTYGDESESRGLRVEEILSILADYNKQYKEKTIQWNICYEKQQLASQEIQNYRQALESFNEMIAWLQDHLDLHDKLKLEAQPHEINELSVNRNVLQERIDQVRDAQGKYTIHLNNTMSECRSADRTCNSMKMECSQLMKMRDQLKNVLLSRGISADMIDKWLEQADPHQPQPIQPLAELHNESLWLHENCTREEAQNILRGRPDGTFLIRMAQNGGYALSIACNKEVQHCRIYQGENGFGFAEPFLIYATLRDLVLHYSKNSLLMHNDLLNTTLNFPARPGS